LQQFWRCPGAGVKHHVHQHKGQGVRVFRLDVGPPVAFFVHDQGVGLGQLLDVGGVDAPVAVLVGHDVAVIVEGHAPLGGAARVALVVGVFVAAFLAHAEAKGAPQNFLAFHGSSLLLVAHEALGFFRAQVGGAVDADKVRAGDKILDLADVLLAAGLVHVEQAVEHQLAAEGLDLHFLVLPGFGVEQHVEGFERAPCPGGFRGLAKNAHGQGVQLHIAGGGNLAVHKAVGHAAVLGHLGFVLDGQGGLADGDGKIADGNIKIFAADALRPNRPKN